MQSALQDEIETLRARSRSEADPAGLAFASLADAYRRAGEMEEAWSVLEEGLQDHPDFATAHLVAARVLRDRGDRVEAGDRYARVLELDPDNTEALLEAAAVAQHDGRIGDALFFCQRLALLDPADPELRARIRALKEVYFTSATEQEAEERLDEPREETEGDGAPEPELAAPEEVAPGQPAPDEEPKRVVDEPAGGSGGGEESEVFTRTMADLYARQGHVRRALKIYGHLLERDPHDETLRTRIQELEAEESEAADGGATISEYFDTLLGWKREGREVDGDADGSAP